MAALYQFETKTVEQIRDDILRSWRLGYLKQGIVANVAPGSDFFIDATGFAEQLVMVQANTAIAADEVLPDTAALAGLLRWASLRGFTLRAGTTSTGPVQFDTSQTTAVAQGAELVDGSGLRYRVTVGGSYADEASIPIESVATGTATELATGTTLRWVSAPAYASETVTVLAPGLKGGREPEGVEDLRMRVIDYARNPPAAGNWSHISLLAEETTGSVQKCVVYPCLQGPGTTHFAVMAAPSATNKSRQLSGTTVNTVIVPSVQGSLAERAYIFGTSVTDVPTDVAVALTLPAAGTAAPPGPGGGWLDGTPWPTYAANGYADVTVVTSSTSLRVHADMTPTAGATRIAWLSPYDWKLYTATLLTVASAGSGLWDITLDTPFTGVTVGCFVWPQASRQQAYVDALLGAFGLMGPGEKTANVSILSNRGFRHPVPTLAWPYALGGPQLRALTDSGAEVQDAAYLYRSTTTPAVPADVEDPPNILTPRHLGFYPS
jgi:uncharacterized phage protein gp47/JayE